MLILIYDSLETVRLIKNPDAIRRRESKIFDLVMMLIVVVMMIIMVTMIILMLLLLVAFILMAVVMIMA